MKLEHEFHVDADVDVAWRVLLDIERIAPCMPGAQLQEVDGDEYRGIVKVKVGPITAQYKGTARVAEADEATHRLVLRAEGRDTRGQGNASATITALLAADGDGTQVSVDTDLNVTGKVAQFGRGVMADVSQKLLGQFVECLQTTILGPDGATVPASPARSGSEPAPSDAAHDDPPAAVTTAATTSPAGPRTIDAPEAEAVDLVRAAGGAVAKRLVPFAAAVVVVAGVVVWLLVR
jgi:carbon monoxide dehydrogenase subunit G